MAKATVCKTVIPGSNPGAASSTQALAGQSVQQGPFFRQELQVVAAEAEASPKWERRNIAAAAASLSEAEPRIAGPDPSEPVDVDAGSEPRGAM